MPIELIASNGPSCDVAVVLHADLDPVVEPGFARPRSSRPARPGGCDSVTPTARTPWCCAAWIDHAAPAAADVEQSHARLEPELAADELVLRRLRGPRDRRRAVGHTAHEYVIEGPSTMR